MPEERKFEITDARGGAALTVRVTTRAERTELAGIQDDGVLKIRLTASSAGDPAANEELVGFIAAQLSVSDEQVAIVAGEAGREKIVSIEGLSTSQVEERLYVGL